LLLKIAESHKKSDFCYNDTLDGRTGLKKGLKCNKGKSRKFQVETRRPIMSIRFRNKKH